MFDTHCYFIEPISEYVHLRSILVKRFLKFVEQLDKTKKSALKGGFNLVKDDCRTTTGSNLRKIMLLLEKDTTASLVNSDASEIIYSPVPVSETWRINFVHELIEIKSGAFEVKSFSYEEINDILKDISTLRYQGNKLLQEVDLPG